MDRPDHRRITDFFPCRRRPSLFSWRKHQIGEQSWRYKENLGQGQGSNNSSLTMCAELRGFDTNNPYQSNSHHWEKHMVKTAGLTCSKPGKGFQGPQYAIDSTSTSSWGITPKRSKSLYGLRNPETENSNDSSQNLWRASRGTTVKQNSGTPPALCGWLRRCMSTTLGRRHRVPKPSTLVSDSAPAQDRPEMLPIPDIGVEPPQIPDSTTSGAAARAAVAAQNEMLESARNMRLAEPKVTRDSESGIGIEVRDRGGESTDSTVPVVRRGLWLTILVVAHRIDTCTDPSAVLPEELVAQVLSYLDAASLINAELVSRRWQRSASSRHSWKHVFHREFEDTHQNHPTQSAIVHVGGQGLGKTVGDQHWKKMWKARQALHQRWRDGYAAAIYLEGHTDCVYCVQFDEYGTQSRMASRC